MKLILVTVGLPGSGKEEFIIIAKKYKFEVIRMGDIVRERTTELGLPITNQNCGMVANEERKQLGFDVWAKRTVPRIKSQYVLIDGTRGDAEVNYFRQVYPENLKVVAIFATQNTRFERIKNRNRPDDPKTLKEFMERDKRELAWGIGNAFSLADYMLINETTKEEFYYTVQKFFQELGFKL